MRYHHALLRPAMPLFAHHSDALAGTPQKKTRQFPAGVSQSFASDNRDQKLR
jgi:hypothetical protein